MYRKTYEATDSEETVVAADRTTMGTKLTALVQKLTDDGHTVIYKEDFTVPNPVDGTKTDYVGKVYYRKGIIV